MCKRLPATSWGWGQFWSLGPFVLLFTTFGSLVVYYFVRDTSLRLISQTNFLTRILEKERAPTPPKCC